MTRTDHAMVPTPGSGAMFDRIAHRYDVLNRVLSMGIDIGWRRRAVKALSLGAAPRVLDVATGTADLALDLARRHRDATVEGIDPSEGMLAVGRAKVEAAGLDDRVHLWRGDALSLPFRDGAFDGATIAFGIRNIPDRVRALSEMARVLKDDARLVVLELGEPRRGILGPAARFWIHSVVPRLGALFVRRDAYVYLQDSIARFPDPDAFVAILGEAGLSVIEVQPLTFGTCNLYVATPDRGRA